MYLLYSLYVCELIDSTGHLLVIRYIQMLLLACNCSSEYNASVHAYLCDSVSQIFLIFFDVSFAKPVTCVYF